MAEYLTRGDDRHFVASHDYEGECADVQPHLDGPTYQSVMRILMSKLARPLRDELTDPTYIADIAAVLDRHVPTDGIGSPIRVGEGRIALRRPRPGELQSDGTYRHPVWACYEADMGELLGWRTDDEVASWTVIPATTP